MCLIFPRELLQYQPQGSWGLCCKPVLQEFQLQLSQKCEATSLCYCVGTKARAIKGGQQGWGCWLYSSERQHQFSCV